MSTDSKTATFVMGLITIGVLYYSSTRIYDVLTHDQPPASVPAMSAVSSVSSSSDDSTSSGSDAAPDPDEAWRERLAALAPTAKQMGITPEMLSAFLICAEENGIDPDEAAQAFIDFEDAVQDARYGRNPELIGVMAAINMKLKIKASGDADYMDALKQLADVIHRDELKGRAESARELARLFDVTEIMPMIQEGRDALHLVVEDSN